MGLRLFILTLGATAFLIEGPAADAKDDLSGSISRTLASHGYRRIETFGSEPSVKVTIDAKPAILVVETGAPFTTLDRDSARALGMTVFKTGLPVISSLGKTNEYAGFGRSQRIILGNIILAKDTITVLDLNGLKQQNGGRADGVFGLSHMQRLGAILSCGEHALYLNPSGASKTGLGEILTSHGFVRVPIHVNAAHNPQVECHINGVAVPLILETAAFTTVIDKHVARRAGVRVGETRANIKGAGERTASISAATAREFAVGAFLTHDEKLSAAEMAFGVLGIDYLKNHDAVIDLGSMNLYLHH